MGFSKLAIRDCLVSSLQRLQRLGRAFMLLVNLRLCLVYLRHDAVSVVCVSPLVCRRDTSAGIADRVAIRLLYLHSVFSFPGRGTAPRTIVATALVVQGVQED